MSDSLQPHGLQHARLPCPSPIPGACSNSCLSSWWYHPTISSSIVPFSSCLQSFPTSGSLPMSQFLTSGGQSIGASVLPINIQDWSPWGWTGWISLQSKGLSRSSPIPQFKSVFLMERDRILCSVFFFLFFWLEDNCFTMLYWFLLYSKVNQL